MPLTSDLMGLGMPPALASKVGYNAPVAIAGAGTTQVGATPLTGSFSLLNPASGASAYIFSTTAPLTKLHLICNPTATAATVFPPVGGSINGGAANAGFTVPANSLIIATQAMLGQWFMK